ncbi:MAG: hypothetical protein N3B16_03670 [Candidatus Aminicenantes bacterium]|nr:hypothetical protein [Candidatus Aminicenantes bacterium]
MEKLNNLVRLKEVETKRLYYYDCYQQEFESRVLALTEYKGRPALILEATCFYPEGGGQPSDYGEIDGVKVIEVIEAEGRIFHLLEREIKAEKVKGKIDWVRRYDHMQQHTGQHLLSQVCWEILGAETLSFNLGEEVASIELSIGQLSEADKKRIETRAAEIIFANRPIKIYEVEEEEIDRIPFRKKPVKSGLIRVVEIDEFDYSACGGTHVKQTGEIGLIKIIGEEKIRQHVRLFFICGWRVLKDYQKKEQILTQLASSLGTSIDQLQVTVNKLQSESKAWRKKCLKLREELNQYEAAKLMAEAQESVIDRTYFDRSLEEAKQLGLKIIHSGHFLVIFGVKGEGRDHLLLARSESIPVDLRQWLPWLREVFEGRGGGSDSLVEIALPGKQPLEEVVKEVKARIFEALSAHS